MNGRSQVAPPAEASVYAVVVNYNSADQTVACVQSLRAIHHPRLSVIVVDNCSPDRSEEELRRRLPDVTILPSGRNLGYGFGCNVGIKHALGCGADLVWLVTPDCRVQRDSLQVLVDAFARHPRLGICGPILRAAGRYLASFRVRAWLGYLPTATVVPEEQLGALADLVPTDYVDGGCAMLRTAMVHQIGPLREDFFLYYEDTEYSLRARDAGWSVAIASHALATTGRATGEERNNRFSLMIRNSILLARVRRRFRLLTFARYAAAVILHLCYLRRQQIARFPAVALNAVWEGLRKPLDTS